MAVLPLSVVFAKQPVIYPVSSVSASPAIRKRTVIETWSKNGDTRLLTLEDPELGMRRCSGMHRTRCRDYNESETCYVSLLNYLLT